MNEYANLHELTPGQLVSLPRDHRHPYEGSDAYIVASVRERDRTDWSENHVEEFVVFGERGYKPLPPMVLEAVPVNGGEPIHLLYGPAGRGHRVKLLRDHYPKCADCGELWPCRDQAAEAAAVQYRHRIDTGCAHCGRSVGGSREGRVVTETPDGNVVTKYHTRKGSPCRKAYLAAVQTDPAALEALRREDAMYAGFRTGAS